MSARLRPTSPRIRAARPGFRAAALVALLATGGCGAGSAPPAQTLTPLFEGSRVDEARATAPHLMAQADAARSPEGQRGVLEGRPAHAREGVAAQARELSLELRDRGHVLSARRWCRRLCPCGVRCHRGG